MSGVGPVSCSVRVRAYRDLTLMDQTPTMHVPARVRKEGDSMNWKLFLVKAAISVGGSLIHVAASAASEKAPALSTLISSIEGQLESALADIAANPTTEA